MKDSSTTEKLILSFFDVCFKHAYDLMQQFAQNTKPDIFRKFFSRFVPSKDDESRCFKIVNKHYLDYIRRTKSSIFIKNFVRRLEEYLQKNFLALNIILYVNRKCKSVHVGMDYPLMLAEVPYELISSIEDFKKQNRNERFHFLFPKSIHTTHWKYNYIILERKDL